MLATTSDRAYALPYSLIVFPFTVFNCVLIILPISNPRMKNPLSSHSPTFLTFPKLLL